jgi:hypothetical protein
LTRASIHLRKKYFSKKMDCRVEPGNDVVSGCASPSLYRAYTLRPPSVSISYAVIRTFRASCGLRRMRIQGERR